MERELLYTRFFNIVEPVDGNGAVEEERISRGMRILFWLLVLSLAVSLIGSLAFLSGRFDDFTYAWF